MSLSSLLVTQEVVSPAIEFNRLRLTSIDIDKQTQYDTKTNNNTAERFAMAGFNLEEKKKRRASYDVCDFYYCCLNLKGEFHVGASANYNSNFDFIVY